MECEESDSCEGEGMGTGTEMAACVRARTHLRPSQPFGNKGCTHKEAREEHLRYKNSWGEFGDILHVLDAATDDDCYAR